jgi:hypothetical protein
MRTRSLRDGIVTAQTSALIGAVTSFAAATQDARRRLRRVIRVDFGLSARRLLRPHSDRRADITGGLFIATSGLMHRSK